MNGLKSRSEKPRTVIVLDDDEDEISASMIVEEHSFPDVVDLETYHGPVPTPRKGATMSGFSPAPERRFSTSTKSVRSEMLPVDRAKNFIPKNGLYKADSNTNPALQSKDCKKQSEWARAKSLKSQCGHDLESVKLVESVTSPLLAKFENQQAYEESSETTEIVPELRNISSPAQRMPSSQSQHTSKFQLEEIISKKGIKVTRTAQDTMNSKGENKKLGPAEETSDVTMSDVKGQTPDVVCLGEDSSHSDTWQKGHDLHHELLPKSVRRRDLDVSRYAAKHDVAPEVQRRQLITNQASTPNAQTIPAGQLPPVEPKYIPESPKLSSIRGIQTTKYPEYTPYVFKTASTAGQSSKASAKRQFADDQDGKNIGQYARKSQKSMGESHKTVPKSIALTSPASSSACASPLEARQSGLQIEEYQPRKVQQPKASQAPVSVKEAATPFAAKSSNYGRSNQHHTVSDPSIFQAPIQNLKAPEGQQPGQDSQKSLSIARQTTGGKGISEATYRAWQVEADKKADSVEQDVVHLEQHWGFQYHVLHKKWPLDGWEEDADENKLGPFYTLAEANETARGLVQDFKRLVEENPGQKFERGWAYSMDVDQNGLQTHCAKVVGLWVQADVSREIMPLSCTVGIPKAALNIPRRVYIVQEMSQYPIPGPGNLASSWVSHCECRTHGCFTTPGRANKRAGKEWLAAFTGRWPDTVKNRLKKDEEEWSLYKELKQLKEDDELFHREIQFKEDGSLTKIYVQCLNVEGPRN